MRALAVAAAVVLASCTSSSGSGGPHPVGAEQFTSRAPGVTGPGGAGGTDVAAGPAAPGEREGAGGRPITEADLHVRRGAMLHVQNAWRGLQLVDLGDPAAPRLRATVPLTGTPVGLYLVGDVALVVSSDHLAWILPADGGPARPSYGARLWAVDVSDPDAPAVKAEVEIDGAVTDTRLVGDVLYLVTRTLPYRFVEAPAAGAADAVGASNEPAGDATSVASFDVSDPAAPVAVDAVAFPHAGWAVHVNATPERITVARAGWDASEGPVTHLTAVDIADPGGKLALGAEVTIPGLVQDRWGLDLDGASGTLRAVVADGWSSGARLHVLSWAEPAAVAPLAALDLDVPERLTAARFDGARGYVVTALAIDPLWVIDLSDPAAPALAGHLELPGQLDFIVPRGDRLLALGHGGAAPGTFQLHVSLLDVSDPAAPALLGRETLDPDWAFVPASPDDLQKAFQVLDAEGLLLVPFQGWDRDAWTWSGGTQLLSFTRDALVREGFVAHRGDLRRAFATAAPGVLAALSDERLQTLDATDRAHPVELASIDLARPVYGIAVAGPLAVELAGWPWWGAAEWVVVPSADPDAPTPAWRAPVKAAWAEPFRLGEVAWLATAEPYGGGGATVQALDLGAGGPRLRGAVELPGPSGTPWWTPDAVQVGTALALERVSWKLDGGAWTARAELVVVDLSDADAPRVAAVVALPAAAWSGELLVAGESVWVAQYDWVDAGSGTVRYTVTRVDLSDPGAPVVSPSVNVPGRLFSASEDGARLYTEEQVWDGERGETWLHVLARTDHGTARLLGSARLEGWYWGAVRVGGHAYAVGWNAGAVGVPVVDSGAGAARLAAVDLGARRVTDVQPLGAGAGIVGAAGDKLVLSAWWPAPAALVLDLADPAHPVLERTVRTSGTAWSMAVDAGVAYLPTGPYGVARVALGE